MTMRSTLSGRFGFAAAVLALVILFDVSRTPAFAQDAPEPAETEQAVAAQRPALIVEALKSGAPIGQSDWAFTQALSNGDGEIVLRHDPALDEGPWRLVKPPVETASDDVLEIVEGIRAAGRGAEVLGYENLSAALGTDIVLAREEARTMVYRFQPVAPPEGGRGRAASFMEKLRGELTVRKSGAGADASAPWIESVRLFAPESFKPNFAARITSFEQIATYRIVDGLPLLEESRTAVAGSAMFSGFEESVTVRILEATPVKRTPVANPDTQAVSPDMADKAVGANEAVGTEDGAREPLGAESASAEPSGAEPDEEGAPQVQDVSDDQGKDDGSVEDEDA